MANTPNKLYETTCGKKIWHSRSCSSVATLFFKTKNNLEQYYVPVLRRGKNVGVEPNKLCLPCGYFDWDEDGAECARREIFEEIGLKLENLKIKHNYYDGFKVPKGFDQAQPWFVNSRPDRDSLQNISLTFGVVQVLDSNKLPKLTTKYNDGVGEVEEIIWMPVDSLSDYEDQFAFFHAERIKMFRYFLAESILGGKVLTGKIKNNEK